MTKIKIIGDPGKQPIKMIKKWVKNALEKFNLSEQEIWLFFVDVENPKQSLKLLRKYIKKFPKKIDVEDLKWSLRETKPIDYVSEASRTEGVPPLIMVENTIKISEDNILHVIAHLREDKEKWKEVKAEAFVLLEQDFKTMMFKEIGASQNSKIIIVKPTEIGTFFIQFQDKIKDFFADEMMVRYGLIDRILRSKQRYLRLIINFFPKAEKDKGDAFSFVLSAAFGTTLSPSYPRKEDEGKLERIVINYIRQLMMESLYRKIKSILSKLKSPPNIANIYKVGSEIIELAQEFLSK